MDTPNLINLGIFIATVGAAIVAAFYTAFTYKMLATMKNQYIDSIKPKIHIKVVAEHRSTMFYLIIKNIGSGIAKDISFTIDKDFYFLSQKNENKNLKNYNLFKNTVPYMPPGDEYTFYLDSARNISDGKKVNSDGINPNSFAITCKYTYAMQEYYETYTIDLKNYFNTTETPNPILTELRTCNENLKKLLSTNS